MAVGVVREEGVQALTMPNALRFIQLLSLPLLSSFIDAPAKLKSMGLGGGAAVSPYTWLRCWAALEAVLRESAALTSWPSEALVRMERRWRGLKVAEGIVVVVVGLIATMMVVSLD